MPEQDSVLFGVHRVLLIRSDAPPVRAPLGQRATCHEQRRDANEEHGHDKESRRRVTEEPGAVRQSDAAWESAEAKEVGFALPTDVFMNNKWERRRTKER